MHIRWLVLMGLATALCGVGGLPVRAGEAIQSDWSGGWGVPGPVTEWGASFDAALGVSWRPVPGQLALSSTAFAEPVVHAIGEAIDGAYAVYGVDIDGDGDGDVLSAATASPNDILLWRNDGGSPPGWTRETVADDLSGGISVCAADVDGDGATDILGASWASGQILWWRNLGGSPASWPRQVIATGFAGAHQVYATDLDGDGDQDVFGAAAEADAITWWRNDGGEPITWTEQQISGSASGARSVYVTDMDGDGDRDVLGAAFDASDILLFLNEGGEPITWTRQLIAGAFAGSHWVYAGDLDQDGDQDILGAAYTADAIAWWRNDGGSPPSFTRFFVDDAVAGAATVHSADLDGDGDLDVLATAWDWGRVLWWENDGAAGGWTEHVASGLGWASGLHAADIEGDGDVDILATGVLADKVVWYEVAQFAASGELTSSILDLQSVPETASLDWDATLPSGADLGVRVRGGDDPASLGAWSAPLTEPGPLPDPLGRYLQYRVELASTAPANSPLLRAITLAWETAGSGVSGDGAAIVPGWRDLRVLSPSRGAVEVEFRLPSPALARLDLLDVAGRACGCSHGGYWSAGEHRCHWPAVPAGIYWCRLLAGGIGGARRVVVVD